MYPRVDITCGGEKYWNNGFYVSVGRCLTRRVRRCKSFHCRHYNGPFYWRRYRKIRLSTAFSGRSCVRLCAGLCVCACVRACLRASDRYKLSEYHAIRKQGPAGQRWVLRRFKHIQNIKPILNIKHIQQCQTCTAPMIFIKIIVNFWPLLSS